MKTFIVFLFFLLMIGKIKSSSTPATDRETVEADHDLEEYLREAIANFREQMKRGIPAINVPILDPLDLRNLELNVSKNLATMNLRIRQLNVRSLSTFDLTHLKPNLEELYLEINMTLPELCLHGHYYLDGKVVKIFPIYGEGNFDINATRIYMSGVGKLGFSNDTLVMEILKLDLHWRNLSVSLENFLGGGNFADVLQKVVPTVGRDIFLGYKPLIMETLEKSLKDEINETFKDPKFRYIIQDIIPKK